MKTKERRLFRRWQRGSNAFCAKNTEREIAAEPRFTGSTVTTL